jgi:tight adherence protein B
MAGIFYFFILLDHKVEKRINYYFEINRSIKDKKSRKERIKMYSTSLKRINEAVRDKLSSIDQEKIDQMLKSAGVKLNPEEYIMLKWFYTAIGAGLCYFILGSIFFLVPGAIIGYVAPNAWLKRRIRIRIEKFNEGLPDMITTIVGSLRSGYSFSQALKTVA